MPRHVVLLRGVNLAGRNRVAMPQLRALLEAAGFEDVATYLQSGNVLLSSRKSPERVARECERLVAEELGLDIAVVVRTRDELAAVVERSPLAGVATDPKRYLVSFLDREPDPAALETVAAAAAGGERLVHDGLELYAWYPDGVGRSKLAALMSGPRLGVVATARNWDTVTRLLELAAP